MKFVIRVYFLIHQSLIGDYLRVDVKVCSFFIQHNGIFLIINEKIQANKIITKLE